MQPPVSFNDSCLEARHLVILPSLADVDSPGCAAVYALHDSKTPITAIQHDVSIISVNNRLPAGEHSLESVCPDCAAVYAKHGDTKHDVQHTIHGNKARCQHHQLPNSQGAPKTM